MRNVVAMILGGGRGTRLLPLTEHRCKPAVPVGGKYRLVDIPISNCINSGVRRIYVLTQYRSASLNRHIAQTYSFDSFSDGFVDVLAAEQTLEGESWFQGPADAVRKNMQVLDQHPHHDALVMNGDILFRHDLAKVVEYHRYRSADVTALVSPCRREQASGFGIVQADRDTRVVSWAEKPDSAALAGLAVAPGVLQRFSIDTAERPFLASMGVYVFRQAVLRELLNDESVVDFGHHVLPRAVAEKRHVFAYPYGEYWGDLGTIRSFYAANLDLASADPSFSFYDNRFPIYTRPRFLPPSKLLDCHVENSLVSEGCLIRGASIRQSVIGVRSVLREGAQIERTVFMGADEYDQYPIFQRAETGLELGVGRGTLIRGAIVDKNARIGRNCQIVNEADVQTADHDLYAIREGVIVVRKNAVIPDGTVI